MLSRLEWGVAMTDDTWDLLASLTARIEKVRGERMAARFIGNLQLRDRFHIEIEDLLERRERLIDELTRETVGSFAR
jgi:hypothetical protein